MIVGLWGHGKAKRQQPFMADGPGGTVPHAFQALWDSAFQVPYLPSLDEKV
jgi:hypothetical protein